MRSVQTRVAILVLFGWSFVPVFTVLTSRKRVPVSSLPDLLKVVLEETALYKILVHNLGACTSQE